MALVMKLRKYERIVLQTLDGEIVLQHSSNEQRWTGAPTLVIAAPDSVNIKRESFKAQ